MADTITAAELLHRAASAVAADDADRAQVDNGVGYSKSDGSTGHALAHIPPYEWDEQITRTAWVLMRRYKAQLADRHGIDFDSIPEPPKPPDGADGDRAYIRFRAEPYVAKQRSAGVAAESKVDFDPVTERFVVTFVKYDPGLVSAVKAIPGRAWNGKSNTVPKDQALAVGAFADQHGLALSDAAADVIAAAVEAQGVETVAEAVAAYRPTIKVGVDSEGFFVDLPYELNERRFTLKAEVGPRFDGTTKVWRVGVSSANAAKLLAWIATQTDIEVSGEAHALMVSEAESAVKSLEASAAMDADIEVPGLAEGFELLPYQKAGVAYALAHKGGVIIGDSPGLGKTAQGLATVETLGAYPCVVVVPNIVKINWQREIIKVLASRTSLIVEGTQRRDIPDGYDFYIVPDSIIGDRWEDVAALFPKAVISDELHRAKNGNRQALCPDCGKKVGRSDAARCPHCFMDIKGRLQFKWSVKRTNGLLHLRDAVVATVPDAAMIGLTGTLITNRAAEVINPLYFAGKLEEFGGEWSVKMRYCLPGDAPILMADLTEKPIAEVEVGDKVIGWERVERANGSHRLCVSTVVAAMERPPSHLQRVGLSDGTTILCTPDHRWWRGGSHMPAGYTAVTNFYRSRGGKLCRVFGETGSLYGGAEYDRGYLQGFAYGDGWASLLIRERRSPLRGTTTRSAGTKKAGVACMDSEPLDRIAVILKEVAVESVRRWVRADGMHVIEGAEMYDLLVAEPGDSDEYLAGFLGGIYDAEGSGAAIHQYEDCNGPACDLIRMALDRFGFQWRQRKDRKSFAIRGGRPEMLRFWRVASPTLQRKLVAFWISRHARLSIGEGKSGRYEGTYVTAGHPRVVSIDPVDGEHVTYGLTTTTGNYVAYGLASKNCGAYRDTYGWKFDGSSNEEELHEKLRMSCYLRRNHADVFAELPPMRHVPSYLEVDAKSRARYRSIEADVINEIGQRAMDKARADIEADAEVLADTLASDEDKAIILRKRGLASIEEFSVEGELRKVNWEAQGRASTAEHLVSIGLLKQVATECKLEAVYEWVEEFFEEDPERKLVLFADNIDVVEGLAAHYGERAVKVRGGMTDEAKADAVDRFQTDESVRLFVGNIKAANVGITLTAAGDVAFVQFAWTPTDHDQAIGRVHGRAGSLRAGTGHYLMMAGTIEEDIFDLIGQKRRVTDAVNAGTDAEGEKLSVAAELVARLVKRAGLPGQERKH